MERLSKKIALVLCIFFFIPGLVVAATVTIGDYGQLLGAEGVLVGETYYDLSFVEGSADSLFSGNGVYGFTFTTGAAASAASTAILEQVLIGEYDNDPTLTYGIENEEYSKILTP